MKMKGNVICEWNMAW